VTERPADEPDRNYYSRQDPADERPAVSVTLEPANGYLVDMQDEPYEPDTPLLPPSLLLIQVMFAVGAVALVINTSLLVRSDAGRRAALIGVIGASAAIGVLGYALFLYIRRQRFVGAALAAGEELIETAHLVAAIEPVDLRRVRWYRNHLSRSGGKASDKLRDMISHAFTEEEVRRAELESARGQEAF
jgi:hypothetical protein